jgi:hypothetical protein
MVLKILTLKHIDLKKIINPRSFRGFFRIKFHGFLFAGLVGLSAVSCTEFDQIGLDLVENKIGVNSTDTLSLVAYSILEDPIPTNQTNRSLLGFYSDPVFGKTRASIYTETRLITTGTRIASTFARDSVLLDSVVLVLAYNGYFGDLSTIQNIQVFELNDSIPTTSVLSNRGIDTKPEVLNSQWNPSTTYRIAPNDSVFVGPDTAKVVPQLRLRLNDSFGRRFIDATESDFESVSNYLEFFRGFKITAEEPSGPGAIAYFSLGSAVSTMLVYYSIIGDTVSTRSRLHEFPINEFARRFNQFENFEHQFASDLIREQVFDNDTIKGEERLFVQSMSNYKVKIRIPYLKNIFDGQDGEIAINSAQLIIPVDSTLIADNYGIASNLLLLRENADGNIVSLRDQLVGSQYFGGNYDEKKKQYVFNITQHIQAVISEQIPNGPLYLLVSGSAENAGRAVLSGTKADNPMRIQIKYTKPI